LPTVPAEASWLDAAPGPSGGALVRLVQFPPVWGRNVSPFALKLETWLRLAGVPFEVRPSMNLAKAPRGKLPFIVDGGREIGDSSLVIRHLKASRGIDPDAGLDAVARAEATALQRLFEDHLYFIMVWSRWIDPAGWAVVGRDFFGVVPAPLRPLVRTAMRRRVRAMLHGQGTGRHDAQTIHGFAREDLDAVATALGERPFFAGDQLTTIDAVAYGFLANILRVPVETELKRIAQGYPSLVAWCETMEAGLYAEA
jgi:glutathione S-transferase